MHPSAHRGFTIMELLVVMIVMGLVASIAIPRLTQRSTQDAMAVRDQLRSLLRVAQKLAVSKNTPVCVVMQAAPARIALAYGNAGACGAQPLIDPGSGQAYGINPVPSGVAIPNLSLRFLSTGRLASAARSVSVAIGGLPALTVNTETGFVN